MKKLSYLIILFNCLINAQCYQKISTGDGHVVLLKSDNSIWGFGASGSGQLANQSSSTMLLPTLVNNLNVWKDVFGISGKSFFIRQNGTLWATGNNIYGSLGINSTSSTNVITQIGTANNWMKIVGSPTQMRINKSLEKNSLDSLLYYQQKKQNIENGMIFIKQIINGELKNVEL